MTRAELELQSKAQHEAIMRFAVALLQTPHLAHLDDTQANPEHAENSSVRSTEVCWATELIESANLRKSHLELLPVYRVRHHQDQSPESLEPRPFEHHDFDIAQIPQVLHGYLLRPVAPARRMFMTVHGSTAVASVKWRLAQAVNMGEALLKTRAPIPVLQVTESHVEALSRRGVCMDNRLWAEPRAAITSMAIAVLHEAPRMYTERGTGGVVTSMSKS
ncbi:hypothetical protein DER45DRAFT_539976 [Fusarium avenaceum]|nr:hypothetical protein DER45DRAFT_539976 [Fusarium avenaceum]